ncbi:MAG TPA: LLM class flavin-dependent oxidoreductase [Methylomirabilota bacterium]|jgi:probable F420-dependent oxidoreductase|nr:LLM class flavin-dependent oxidoreductase [Methylomirabilota bacterium]
MATGTTPCGIAIPQTFVNPQSDLPLIRDFVRKAETLPYDSLWVQEQILTDYALLEPVALLNYVAALTSKLRLGTSVLLPVIRNPVQLAKELATLDQLSQGRLIVGVGVGGPHAREAVFGVPSEHRARRFVESLQVMKALWTQPRATMSGNFWRFENVPMEPRPLQQPHPPIWFGARTEIGIKRAVRHGDGWMGAGSSSSADFVQHVEWLRRFLAAANRDPATFPISKRVYLAVDDNKSRAEQRLREWFGRRYLNAEMATQVSIWGGLQECLDKLGELVRAGAQHLLLNPVFDEMEHMELLAREVVPRL